MIPQSCLSLSDRSLTSIDHIYMVSSVLCILDYSTHVTLPEKTKWPQIHPRKNDLNGPHDVFASVFHVSVTILKHFAKTIIKIYKKFVILDFPENFQNLEKISRKISDFSIGKHMENEKPKFHFLICHMIFNGKI